MLQGGRRLTEDYQDLFFPKQENQVREDHNEYIDKNVIQALKKMNKSYNPVFINYINDKFKDIMLECAL